MAAVGEYRAWMTYSHCSWAFEPRIRVFWRSDKLSVGSYMVLGTGRYYLSLNITWNCTKKRLQKMRSHSDSNCFVLCKDTVISDGCTNFLHSSIEAGS